MSDRKKLLDRMRISKLSDVALEHLSEEIAILHDNSDEDWEDDPIGVINACAYTYLDLDEAIVAYEELNSSDKKILTEIARKEYPSGSDTFIKNTAAINNFCVGVDACVELHNKYGRKV